MDDNPDFSRSNFSCSIRARSAFVTRGFRVVDPPREPGPEAGRLLRAVVLALAAVPRAAVLRAEPPPRLPRPRPRLDAPSALYRVSSRLKTLEI